jgi:ABC-type molybdate transport system ATPase subunit
MMPKRKTLTVRMRIRIYAGDRMLGPGKIELLSHIDETGSLSAAANSRLKKRLIPFLLRIRDEFQIPLIYVTHDAGELVALCDEVLLLERGQLIGRGPPADVLA